MASFMGKPCIFRFLFQIQTLFLLSVLLLLSGCNSHRFFEENKSIPNDTWNSSDKVSFHVTMNDVKSSYSFYINLRNTGEYPYSNLFIFLSTRLPNGNIAVDTIECTLADNMGNWLGSGITDVKFNRLLFHKGVRFPQPGVYVFEMEQAMRTKELKGISEVGIRLEKE